MQADRREGELGFNHTMVLVDNQKDSADREADRQDNWKMCRQVSRERSGQLFVVKLSEQF
jgi:hypothetical protein